MNQIYVKANNDNQLQKLEMLFKSKNFKVKFASKEWRFMPVLINFSNKNVSNITSASMCHCLFNIAKEPLINFDIFETILNLNKEN